MRPPTDPDLITLHAAAVALARSMRGEPDARRFVEGLSPHLREVIPHDRLLLIREDETPVPSLASWLTLPLEGVDRAIGSLAIAPSAPATYTEAHATTARRIAEMLGPLVENMVLLQKERDRRRRMAVLPEVSRVIAGSLDVRNIFQELGAAVRTVLDFDLMLVRPIGASGTLQRSVLLVGDVPADLQPERRLEDYSFGARLAAKEIVLLGDARRELDQSFPGDRAALERGVRSVIVAPLVFGDMLGGVLAFAKHDPDWFDEGDAEVVSGIAAQVVVALQHQRLSEEQQRVAAAEPAQPLARTPGGTSAGSARRTVRLRQHHGALWSHSRGVGPGSPGRRAGDNGPAHGRKRDREGAGRSRHPLRQPTFRRAVRGGQLRRTARNAGGVRALRT